jgi:hypothetical protein
MHVLDLAQNSIEAGARHVRIDVVEDAVADALTVTIADDGRGMDEETVRQVTDPFFTTRSTRRVGLGLSLLEEAAEAAGGSLAIDSQPGRGTTVTATFRRSHLDRAPLGDLPGTIFVLVASNPEVTFTYRHVVDGREFAFDGPEFRATLGDMSPQNPAILRWLRQALDEGPAES